MPLFNRTASVEIGPKGGTGFRIQDLRIVFEVVKTTDEKPNKATIQIYNLSEASRNKIKETGEKVFIRAGYTEEAGEQVVFIGDVTAVNHKWERPNVITVINAEDGKKNLLKSKVNLSYGPGATGKTVLNAVLKALPFPKELKESIVPSVQYANGFAFAGPARKALSGVCDYLGLEYSVQNDVLTIIKKEGNDGLNIINLSPETGLIGSPERIVNDTRKDKGKDSKVKPGWKVTSLLQPPIVPNGLVSIESKEIPDRTAFKVISVQHSGDNMEGKFESVFELIE